MLFSLPRMLHVSTSALAAGLRSIPRPRSVRRGSMSTGPSRKLSTVVSVYAEYTPSCDVQHFPVEVLHKIFDFLDEREILRCAATCRRFKHAADTSLAVQHRLELARLGLLDNPTSASSMHGAPLGLPERLRLLRADADAWATRDLVRQARFEMSVPRELYAYAAGVLVALGRAKTTLERRNTATSFVGPTSPSRTTSTAGLGQSQKSAGAVGAFRPMTVAWLPSSTSPARSLALPSAGITCVENFAVDPSQDLLALLRVFQNRKGQYVFQVHLRTLSANAPYPTAHRAYLGPVESWGSRSQLQIVDNIIALVVHENSRSYIIEAIWDWKTGKSVIGGQSIPLPHNTHAISFISNNTYIIVSGDRGGALDIFTFNNNNNIEDAVTGPGPASTSLPLHVASLTLPALQHKVSIGSAEILAGAPLPRTPPHKPFTAAPGARVHTLVFNLVRTGANCALSFAYFHLFLHERSIASRVAEYLHRAREASSFEAATAATTVVPWEGWGPREARYLDSYVPWADSSAAVHGQRVVLRAISAGCEDVRILDFNVSAPPSFPPLPPPSSVSADHHVHYPAGNGQKHGQIQGQGQGQSQGGLQRRASVHTSSLTPKDKWKMHTKPTRVPAGEHFKKDVVTTLPFKSVSRPELFSYKAVMLDDDKLIGLRYNEDDDDADPDSMNLDLYAF